MNDWLDAERHAERANQLYETGRLHEALVELKKAIHFNPHKSDWHFGLGLTLDALDRYDEAVNAFRSALQLNSNDTTIMLHLAVDLIRCEQLLEADQLLARIAVLNPRLEESYCYRILTRARMGDHDAAETMFYLARQILDECPRCYDHIAHSYALRNMTQQAVWCWRQTLRLDPQYPDVHANLARIYWQDRQYELARHACIRQLRVDPGDIQTLLDFGTMLIDCGQFSEAAEKFRRVIELQPDNPDAHCKLGQLALACGHYDAAARKLRKARRLDPGMPCINLALAQIAMKQNDRDKAEKYLLCELDCEGHTLEQIVELARALLEMKLPRQVIGLLDPLIDAHHAKMADKMTLPDTPDRLRSEIYLCRGVAHLFSQNRLQGIRDCRQAARCDPTHRTPLRNLILACLDNNQFDRAMVFLRKAYRLQPDQRSLNGLYYRIRYRQWLSVIRHCLRDCTRKLLSRRCSHHQH